MGIPEYWVIDVRARRIEVRRRPTLEGYALIERLEETDDLAIARLDGVTLSARRIFERLRG